MIAPKYEQLAQLNPDISFYTVDVDEQSDISFDEQIQAVSVI